MLGLLVVATKTLFKRNEKHKFIFDRVFLFIRYSQQNIIGAQKSVGRRDYGPIIISNIAVAILDFSLLLNVLLLL